jgi:trehalose-6-phosphate hydrolase
MLATTIHMMQGTPYIYQGEEIGMTDPKYTSIEQYRDVESLNMYTILKQKNLSEEEILEILKRKSRDNSRTPVQWDNSKYAGFTTGTPWINVANNYKEINAENAVNDPNSVFYHYRKLISLRKEYDIITDGDYELLLQDDQQIFAYVRTTPTEKLLVVNNFYEEPTTFELPEHIKVDDFSRKQLLSNYPDSVDTFEKMELRPYESVVYYFKKS